MTEDSQVPAGIDAALGNVGRRALVTGAAGFIGSQVCRALLRDGWSVTGIDGFTDSYDPVEKIMRAASLARLAGMTLVVGNMADMALDTHLNGVEVVFHLAGRAGVRASFTSEAFYIRDNVVATERLLAATRRAGVRRLVYASSSSVYGDGAVPFREDGPLVPISPYGKSKLEAEKACLEADDRGIETTALRYFTVFGPGQRPDMGLRLLAEAALTGQPIRLLGDGSQRRDFTYVTDVVAATIAAADGDVAGLAVNIGGGSDVSIRDVLAILARLTGAELLIDEQPFARGDVRVTSADLTRARRLLRFTPLVPFEVGYESQVAWLRERLEQKVGVPV